MSGTRYAKKSDWATARSIELQHQALARLAESSGGCTRRARAKFDAVRRLEAEAMRFNNIAQALRRRGK